MITLLVIIFIICMVVMKMKDSPEQEREHQARYLGEDFANKEYYRKEAKRQIKEEDKKELKKEQKNYKEKQMKKKKITNKDGNVNMADRSKELEYKLSDYPNVRYNMFKHSVFTTFLSKATSEQLQFCEDFFNDDVEIL